ncbi:MAG: 2-oxoacid:acceptor oxidoreductase subunit alpha [Candidatus Sumerlaeia bacterium]|nr:2-oxoacid:acceptor oxidoreductase subunit alpha [Candidatus Sumerlaeia bacterium]
MSTNSPESAAPQKPTQELLGATIRFAGDSGDGMQLTGTQFTNSSAVFGNDVSTFPDFPAEIRAPQGTLFGVSGFQVKFSSEDIHTPGDVVDTLVAMNPAALRNNLRDLKVGGILICNEDSFNAQNLKLANYATNPLEDGSLSQYKLFTAPMTKMTVEICEPLGVAGRDAQRCKNFFALGLVSWLYSRPLDTSIHFIETKFTKDEVIKQANLAVLKAGYNFGETAEFFQNNYAVKKAKLKPGLYREIRGNEALAMGLVAASALSGKPLFYGSYPITPASDILHELAKQKNFGVKTFQAEDEIAAITSAIGAAFGGALAVTGSSGPGIALKAEAIGLATMIELPLVIVNVQRGGPSTGLPTKTEQADLMQAMYGRNGECPVVVIAAATPGDCFHMALEAARIAFRSMVPVMLLSDGYIANSSEPWLVPNVEELEPITVEHLENANGPDGRVLPYLRDENLSRPWILPGTPGLMHRVGGLEKQDGTGNINYEAENHQHMINTRQAKVDRVANHIPAQEVYGDQDPDLLLVGWGGTHGALREATNVLRHNGHKVGHAHLRYLNPFPSNLEAVLKSGKKVLVCELNSGQLRLLLRGKYLVDCHGLNKVQGKPFFLGDITRKAEELLGAVATR